MSELSSFEMVNADELKDYVEQNGVSKVDEYVSSKLDEWKEVEIHFAVCGVSGSGKSSFINCIRGLDDLHCDAAEVDEVECTKEPKCYDHPTNPKIKFWDLPGITNPIYEGDLKKYCENVPFDKFHTYLIFAKDRFTADELKLIEVIRSTGKKFFFIRSRIDQDVENAKRRRKHSFDKDATLEKIRKNCTKNLIDNGLLQDEKEIFLISSHFPAEYQFDDLTQAILAVLPQRQKESLLLTIDNALSLSEKTLQAKVEVLKGRIKYVATISATAAAVPGAGIAAEIALISREINFYKRQLGLPTKGSIRFSLLSNNTQNELKALALGSVSKVGSLVVASSVAIVVEEFASVFIPFIGIAVTSSLSYGTTYYFLKCRLNDMEKLAVKVLKETLDKIRPQ